jgi:predicted TIM-barrel fold metal-dependent hydrolase
MSMIVDAHTHLGYSHIFSMGIAEQELIGTMDRYGIDVSVVMPAAGADIVPTHDAIAQLAEKYPGRIFGMASLTPLIGESDYAAELRRCVRELGFHAVKLHPLAHAVMPTAPAADVVFATAAELQIPVMVHTGTGVPFSLPSVLIPRALEYPDTPIILAHAGFAVYTPEAFVAAQVCSNIYLEPSWCMAHDVKRMVQQFGADRVMYGGDLPSNVPVELAKFQSLDLPEDAYEMCMAGTAIKVFKLPVKGGDGAKEARM